MLGRNREEFDTFGDKVVGPAVGGSVDSLEVDTFRLEVVEVAPLVAPVVVIALASTNSQLPLYSSQLKLFRQHSSLYL